MITFDTASTHRSFSSSRLRPAHRSRFRAKRPAARTSSSSSSTISATPTPALTAAPTSRRRTSIGWPSEGVKFTDFYSNAPVCTPTRCGFITGRWQQRTGLELALGFAGEQTVLRDGQWVPEPDALALGLPTTETVDRPDAQRRRLRDRLRRQMASRLSARVQSQCARLRRVLRQPASATPISTPTSTKTARRSCMENDKHVEAKGYLTDLYNRRAVDFIDRHAAAPFFLYVPYNAVHFPFQVPDDPDSRMDPKDMYDGTRADYRKMVERDRSGRRRNAGGAGEARHRRQHAVHFLQRQRRRATQRQSAALQPQAIALGRRHSRAVPDALARRFAEGKSDAPAGDHDGPDGDDRGGLRTRRRRASSTASISCRCSPARSRRSNARSIGACRGPIGIRRRFVTGNGSTSSTAHCRCSSIWRTTSASASISDIAIPKSCANFKRRSPSGKKKWTRRR